MATSRAETPSRTSPARGSIGTARVWDEATRSARRRGETAGTATTAGALAPGALVPEQRMAEIVGQAVRAVLAERGLDGGRGQLALEIQARVLAWLTLDLLPHALDPAPATESARAGDSPAPPVPPEVAPPPLPAPATTVMEPRPALGRRLREELLRIAAVTRHAGLLERLVELALRAPEPDLPEVPGASPEERERLEVLRRRLAKLQQALEEARRALGYVSRLETVDTGLASIYRTVQGLAAGDPLCERKQAALEQLFRANLDLQKNAR